jgi:predicted outer membrane repeat protein
VQFVGPGAGAGITPALSVATTDNSGIATLTATANAITGTFTVSVTVAGAAEVIPFTLTNYNCAALLVENANDSGDGSLRKAIEDACPGATISFTNDQTIYLNSPLSINKTLTIDGSTQDVVISGDSNNDGTRNVQPFRIQSSGVVTITHLSVISGTTSNTGGGAILNQGDLRVYNSYFQNNHSTTGSGGGAIYSTNRLTVLNSTFYSNTAEIGGGISVEGIGTIANSTFSDNNVVREGGGVYNRATLLFRNNTVADNMAFLAGGLYNRSGGSLTLNNTLFVNNTGALECWNSGGLTTSNNLASGSNSCNVPTSSTIYLSGLGEYGGDTPTYALQLGSSAINAGNIAQCAADPVNNLDQRGEARSDSCDIGAFEAHFTLAMTGGDAQSATINTPFANPLEVTISGTNNAPVGTNGTITFTGPTEGAGISGNVSDSPDGNGVASANVSANGIVGSYVVTATTAGVDAPILFALTNTGFVVLEDATFNVDEDATNGTVLGTVPTDNQTGNAITYQVVSGNEDEVFALNSSDGEITVADNSTLDYETTTAYLLTVSAGDGALTDTATINISVNNLFADVSIDKQASSEGTPAGAPLTYTLTFENEGREISSGVVITDLMPAKVTVIDIEVVGDAGVVITPDGTDPYVWTVSDLLPGTGGVITITTEVNGDATRDEIINHAEISTSDEEDDTTNNEATVNTALCLVESIVTSDADNGKGSLREALTTICDGGIITFDADMTITVETDPIFIERSVTVDGTGHDIAISGDAGIAGDPSDNVTAIDIYAESPISVTLKGLTVRDGQNPEGGSGVNISPSSFVTIDQSLVTHNTGSAIGNSGTLILENSTVSDNEGAGAVGVNNGYEAIAIIRNSTVSGNRAMDDGAGVYNWYGDLTIINSTIISNTANSDGDDYGVGAGLYYAGNSSAVTVTNSIIAGNLQVDVVDPQVLYDDNCYRDEIDGMPTPLMVDGGYNLVGDDGGCIADSGTTLTISRAALFDTVLEPLGDYGGATPSHALRNASPAIDIIPSALCDVTADQRGQPRGAGVAQGGTACDIGAYEAFSTNEVAGDVSCDSWMNTVDGLFTLQFGAGTRETDYTCGLDGVSLHLPSCDTNIDGICNSEDGSLMLQCDVGLDNSFCPITPFGGKTRPLTATRGGAVVTVGDATIAIDQTQVTIPIRLDAPMTAMGALHVIVTYDESVIDVADCSAAVDSAFDEGYCNANSAGEVRFNGVVADGVTGEDMVVGTITFQRGPPVIIDTTIPLPITVQTFADPNGVILPVTGVAGQLTVRAIPLAVTLADFTAIPQSSEVLVGWETASEVDNLGFNLLRATSSNVNSAIQLNDELILSQSPGGGQGALYEWEDRDVTDGVTYWYWLESVDRQGNIVRFGPVTAIFGSPTAVEIARFETRPTLHQPAMGFMNLIALTLVCLWYRVRKGGVKIR